MDDDTPTSVDDPELGHLRWDPKLDWWTGSVELFPGHRVDVNITHDVGIGQPADEIAAARRALARVREQEPEYRRWSADRFHQTRWNTDEPMTPAEINDLLRVASVAVWAGGDVWIYWDDQDRLFWGNNVLTEVGPDGECKAARME
jgi:hypothetical protein